MRGEIGLLCVLFVSRKCESSNLSLYVFWAASVFIQQHYTNSIIHQFAPPYFLFEYFFCSCCRKQQAKRHACDRLLRFRNAPALVSTVRADLLVQCPKSKVCEIRTTVGAVCESQARPIDPLLSKGIAAGYEVFSNFAAVRRVT